MYPYIHIGPIFISSYKVAMLFAAFVCWLVFILTEERFWQAAGIPAKIWVFTELTLRCIICMLIIMQGACYFHYIFDVIPEAELRRLTLADILLTNPFKTVKFIYGAIFFAPIAVFFYTFPDIKKRYYKTLNQKTFIFALGVGIIRLGCFLKGCCFGIRSDTFGITFPAFSAVSFVHRERGLTHGFFPHASLPVIPTQLISAIAAFILAFYAWRAAKHGKEHIFFPVLFYYAVFRFLIEFIRDDPSQAVWWIFSSSQWISIFIFSSFAVYFGVKWVLRSQKDIKHSGNRS